MDILRTAIEEDTYPDLKEVFKASTGDVDEHINLLGEMVALLVAKDGGQELIDSVFEQWDIYTRNIDNTYITLVESFACSNDDLRYITENASVSGIRYMINLILDNPSFGIIMNRLLYAYSDKLTTADMDDLEEHVSLYENRTGSRVPDVINYIRRTKKVYVKKPGWVSLKNDESISYLKSVSLGLDLEQKNIFMEQLRTETSKLTVPENINYFIDQFSRNSTDILDKSVSYTKSFRTWGPENRFEDRDCIANPEGKGPCRMLVCTCRYVNDTDDVVINTSDHSDIDWFAGKCDSCDKYIRDRSHSLRFPHLNGGWKGCYCSVKCLNDLPPYQLSTDDNTRMKDVMQRIKEVGIMDRSLL